MGIGNPLRKDDFIGMEVVRTLRKLELPNVHLIEAHDIPENYTGLVEEVSPTHILLIDSADLGCRPGSVRFISPSIIDSFSISTHSLPLSIMSKYLTKKTGAKVSLLAIQPKSLDFGEGLSEELSKSAEDLCRIIGEVIIELGRED
jgi:hydrogenase 3 maturation protease